MGKHINELRRKATNESLAKRAKELVKKWRNMVLPSSNGQLQQTTISSAIVSEDSNSNQSRKRPASEKPDAGGAIKKIRVNGTSELDYSDNSNSSFKDVINSSRSTTVTASSTPEKRDVILINSDSNSSFPEIVKQEPTLELQQPKKRGRKKGSKNHRNLLDEAESSFTNKMAVSRGNAKVKTTQELVESLQNRSGLGLPGGSKPMENLMERAAKLTERVSIIDQKLNTNANRYKNSQKKNRYDGKNDRVIESGVVVNITSTDRFGAAGKHEDEIIIVDDGENEKEEEVVKEEVVANVVKSLSEEEALALLPPIDRSFLEVADPDDVRCTCVLKEKKPKGFSIDGDESEEEDDKIEFLEDCNCDARAYLEQKYHLRDATDDRVISLHSKYIANVNGNFSLGSDKRETVLDERELFVNVVPNVNTDCIPKSFHSENFKKYNISDQTDEEEGDWFQGAVKTEQSLFKRNTEHVNQNEHTSEQSEESLHEQSVGGEMSSGCEGIKGDIEKEEGATLSTFREWHEVVEVPSYGGDILRILPYVIID